jgi:hypothetical protein
MAKESRVKRVLLSLGLFGVVGVAMAGAGWTSFQGAFPGLACNDGWAGCLVDGAVVNADMVQDGAGRPHPANMRVGFFDLKPLPAFSPFGGLSPYAGAAVAAAEEPAAAEEEAPVKREPAEREEPEAADEREERPAAVAGRTAKEDDDYGAAAPVPVATKTTPEPATPTPTPVVATRTPVESTSNPNRPPPATPVTPTPAPTPVATRTPVEPTSNPNRPPPAAPVTPTPTPTPVATVAPKAPPPSQDAVAASQPVATRTAAPVDNSCDDLVSLEAPAMMGQLGPERRKCLEGSLAGAGAQTQKNKISRVLLSDAEARADKGDWERLMKRHLEDIDRSDPNLCMKYAIHLSRGGVARSHGVIKWADYALDNKQQWTGATYTKNVNNLYKLRAVGAKRLWEDAEAKFVADRNDENEGTAAKYRGQAKDYAREWLDYARASGSDTKEPLGLCVSAAGNKEFCGG